MGRGQVQRTWALTPVSPDAKPPSVDDERQGVEFNPIVTVHLLR